MKPGVAVNVLVTLLGIALLVWHEPLRWQLGSYGDFLPFVLLAAGLFALRGLLLALFAAATFWERRRAGRPSDAPRPGAVLVTCPDCRRPSESIKRYGMLGHIVFLAIFIQVQREDHVACPGCMRRRLADQVTSLGRLLGGNVLWPVVVVLPACVQLLMTFVPGHSRFVRKALEARLTPAVQPAR